jgi:hypothetical protein
MPGMGRRERLAGEGTPPGTSRGNGRESELQGVTHDGSLPNHNRKSSTFSAQNRRTGAQVMGAEARQTQSRDGLT